MRAPLRRGASPGALTRHAGRLYKLASAVTPGKVVVALAAARIDDPRCLVERLHFYPVGGFDATAAWPAAVAHTRFYLTRHDSDIAV